MKSGQLLHLTEKELRKLQAKSPESRRGLIRNTLSPVIAPLVNDLFDEVERQRIELGKFRKRLAKLQGLDTRINNLTARAIRAEQMAAAALEGLRSGGNDDR